MPGLFSKVSEFLKSPQGRKYTDQAKRYAQENTVGRPAIQEFVGALAGNAANQGGRCQGVEATWGSPASSRANASVGVR